MPKWAPCAQAGILLKERTSRKVSARAAQRSRPMGSDVDRSPLRTIGWSLATAITDSA